VTEANVKRIMLTATIAAVTLMNLLAIAGLVVITRGPQSRALPMLRTEIAAVETSPALQDETAPALLLDDPSWGPEDANAVAGPAATAPPATTGETTTTSRAAVGGTAGAQTQNRAALTPRSTTTTVRDRESDDRRDRDRRDRDDDHDREVIGPHIREVDKDDD
jgi:hypothetical protein